MKVPAYPLPNMQTIICDLCQAKFLTSIDIMDAFFCMELDEESKKYTAFVTEDGLWECNVCSFGLASFPGEFQTRMNKVFQVAIFGSWLTCCIIKTGTRISGQPIWSCIPCAYSAVM